MSREGGKKVKGQEAGRGRETCWQVGEVCRWVAASSDVKVFVSEP